MRDDILRQRLDVDVPARSSLHQCVKGAAVDPADRSRRCIVCKNYKLNLKTSTCFDCLATEHLDYFAVDDLIKDEAWYQYIMSHPEEEEV